jgi:hypothetical protein
MCPNPLHSPKNGIRLPGSALWKSGLHGVVGVNSSIMRERVFTHHSSTRQPEVAYCPNALHAPAKRIVFRGDSSGSTRSLHTEPPLLVSLVRRFGWWTSRKHGRVRSHPEFLIRRIGQQPLSKYDTHS